MGRKNYDDPFLSAAWGINHSRELRVEYPFKIGPWESTFYSPVQEITPFRDFLKKVLDNQKGVLRADNLNWMKRLDRLQDADYVDVKYDAVSHKVEVSVYWGPSEVDRSGYLVTNAEVGIMGTDRAEEEEEVKVAGYIYEIGDSDHLGISHTLLSLLELILTLIYRTSDVLLPFPPSQSPLHLHPHNQHPNRPPPYSPPLPLWPFKTPSRGRRLHTQCLLHPPFLPFRRQISALLHQR